MIPVKKVLCFLICIISLQAMAQENLPKPCTGPRTALIPFLKGTKWGFCDSTKKLVIPAVYDEVLPFGQTPGNTEKWHWAKEDEAYVRKGKQAFWVNRNGETRLVTGGDEKKPQEIMQFEQEGSWPSNYSANGKQGFIMKEDTTVPAIYDEVRRLTATDYLVRTDRKFGVVDNKKNVIVPVEFEEIRGMQLKDNTRAYEVLNEKLRWGVYAKGKVVLPVQYRSIEKMEAWSLDWYSVNNDDNTWALLDGHGKMLGTTHQGIERYDAETDRFCVKDKDKWGFMDSKGNVVIPCRYDSVEPFDYRWGIALVTTGKRSFYVDCNGVEYCSK